MFDLGICFWGEFSCWMLCLAARRGQAGLSFACKKRIKWTKPGVKMQSSKNEEISKNSCSFCCSKQSAGIKISEMMMDWNEVGVFCGNHFVLELSGCSCAAFGYQTQHWVSGWNSEIQEFWRKGQ